MAVKKLDTVKKSWATSMTRKSEAITDICPKLKPGAISREKKGAKAKITRDRRKNANSTKLREALAIYQAWD